MSFPPKVKVTFVPAAVAFAESSNVVAFVIEATEAPAGTPVPVTDNPTDNFAVLSIVTVASAFVVSHVASVN